MTKPKDRSPAMQFYFRQFMGDDSVILMDLDAVGAHILLMCFAGSSKEGYRIENKDEILRKILRGVGPSDWERIKPQVMTAWEESDDKKWIIQRGMQRTLLKQKEFSKKQAERANKRYEGCRTGAERVPDELPNGCSSSSSSSSSNNTLIRKTHKSIYPPKKKYGEFVFLTDAEHEKYLNQFGQEFLTACIEKLDAWIGSNPIPKRITNGKNAAACFRSWVFNSVTDDQNRVNKNNKPAYQPHTAASTVEKNLEYYRRQNEPVDLEELLNTFSGVEEKPYTLGIGGSSLVPSIKTIK